MDGAYIAECAQGNGQCGATGSVIVTLTICASRRHASDMTVMIAR
jgi:hypothetical protein